MGHVVMKMSTFNLFMSHIHFVSYILRQEIFVHSFFMFNFLPVLFKMLVLFCKYWNEHKSYLFFIKMNFYVDLLFAGCIFIYSLVYTLHKETGSEYFYFHDIILFEK